MSASSRSSARVQEALRAHGLDIDVTEVNESTRTAADAARVVGCRVAQIAKSLVFAGGSGRAYLVIASGANRVDPARVAEHVGEGVRLAPPDLVRESTGFAIGGVPPVGLATDLPTLVDEDLLAHDRIWAAAGTPRSLFPIAPERLVQVTGGRVCRVAAG